ncbi:MAG: ribosome maturation factor RimP [Actinomycetota bacterium]
MARHDVVSALRPLCEQILARRGLESVEFVFTGDEGLRVLRLTVDRVDGGVGIDELAEVSEEISRALDMNDPIEGRYTLEVSSAGLDRPLVKPQDYVRFSGREVKVRCDAPVEGRKNFQGVLQASNADSFVLRALDETFEIPYTAVARTRLVVDWAEELKGGHS